MKKIFKVSIFVFCIFILNLNLVFASGGTISGEIHYAGLKAGSVHVAIFNLQLDFKNIIQDTTLDMGSGLYEFKKLDDGTYIIGAFMDVNGDGLPGFIEPLGAHPKPVNISGGNVVTSVDVYLNDLPRGNSSISGSIIYNGDLTGKPHIFALGLSGTPFNFNCPQEGATSYQISGMMSGEYMVVGFLDQDGDGRPDLSEPMGYIDEQVKLSFTEDLTGCDIEFFESGQFAGSIYGNIDYAHDDTGTVYIYAVGKSRTPINVTEIKFPEQTTFEVNYLDEGEYYLFAYLDLNCSRNFDPLRLILDGTPNIEQGEPYEFISIPVAVYGDEYVEQNLFLDAVGDAGISGHITYAGSKPGFLVLTAALGLSPTWMGIAPANENPDGGYDYLIPNLDAGIYGVLGIMINSLNIDFKDYKSLLELPIGFYTNDFVCVKPGQVTAGVDFILQDSSTTTSEISGTITAPDDKDGDIYVFALGISITPYHHQVLTTEITYSFPNLRMGRFLVGAFMDLNDNGTYDINEPYAVSDSLVNIPCGELVRIVDLKLGDKIFVYTEPYEQRFNPKEFALGQNYPNPFNPTTSFKYQLAESRHVEIKVYNMLGHEVQTLINKKQNAGQYEISWDGKNCNGKEVASGVYLCCMKAGDYFAFKKMTLMR